MRKLGKVLAMMAITLALSAATGRADLMDYTFLDIIPQPQNAKALGQPEAVSSFAVAGDAFKGDAPLERALERALGKEAMEGKGGGAGALTVSFAATADFSEEDCTALKCERDIFASNEESYALKIAAADGGGVSAVVYSDHSRGRFYAVKTIQKLLEKYNRARIDQVVIYDYPTIPVRGIVEGYYGKPWGAVDTFRTIDWMGDNKMNIFLYAPKDDPKNRSDWRAPYTEKEIARFVKFNDLAKLNNMQFCWELSPGAAITYSSQKDFEDMIAKFYSVADVGVDCYVLAFDDTTKAMAHEEDNAAYKNLGEAQADLTNRAYKAIKARVPNAKFSFVPVEYWNEDVTEEYSGTVGDVLEPDIVYGWTGNEICSYSVTRQDAEWEANYINRKPMLGDNIPVVDTFAGQKGPIHLGPLVRRAEDLHETISGFVANGMPWVYSSWVNFGTIADYAWNPRAYDAQRSWKNAIIQVVGVDAYSAFKPFAVLNQGSLVNHHDSQDLEALLQRFWIHFYAGDIEPARADFIGAFQEMAALEGEITARVQNKELVDELSTWLRKATTYGELGLKAFEVADKYLKVGLTDEELAAFDDETKRALRKQGEITRQTLKPFFNDLLEALQRR